MGAVMTDGDRSEVTGALAGLAHAEPAVVGHGIRGNGTLLAGRTDHLDHIVRLLIRICRGAKPLRQTDPLPHDLTFLVNAAPILRDGSRDQLIYQRILRFLRQIIVPRQTRNLLQNFMFQAYDALVVRYHVKSPCYSSQK